MNAGARCGCRRRTDEWEFIPFVCPSRTPIRGERARARGVVVEIDDGQTMEYFFQYSSVRLEDRSRRARGRHTDGHRRRTMAMAKGT
jgi:hypothetical protein